MSHLQVLDNNKWPSLLLFLRKFLRVFSSKQERAGKSAGSPWLALCHAAGLAAWWPFQS